LKPLPLADAELTRRSPPPQSEFHVGDVKYHLGLTQKIAFPADSKAAPTEEGACLLTVGLTPNPSHLEAVDPVVMGQVHARQQRLGDATKDGVMGLLLHGDAAFSGLGGTSEVRARFALPDLKTWNLSTRKRTSKWPKRQRMRISRFARCASLAEAGKVR